MGFECAPGKEVVAFVLSGCFPELPLESELLEEMLLYWHRVLVSSSPVSS